MPVAPGPQLDLRRSLLFGVLSVAVGIGLVILLVTLAGRGDVDVNLGDDRFEVGDATEFAAKIANDRGPRLYPSLDGNRPIFLQHLGDDPLTGWSAIDARSPTDPATCGLTWDTDRQLFVDDCGGGTTYPPDGEGLLQYRVEVDAAEKVVVDLRGEPGAP
jgi:hypothetical protein